MVKNRQSGAVSLFAVIFAALLLTVLTIGFVKLMAQDQQQATNNDLSQSAYDAALAGVEDAKRVIRQCQQDASSSACVALADKAKVGDCQVISRARGVTSSSGETIVQSNSSDGGQFNQAYTCVNINLETEDYLYSASEGTAELVPLKAVGDFSKIVISWYTQTDAGVGVLATAPPSDGLLPVPLNWGAATPPMMRAQLITPGTNFDLAKLDRAEASRTVFVKPNGVVSGSTAINSVTVGGSRPADSEQFDNAPSNVICSRNFANDDYSCRVTLELGHNVTPAESVNAFMRLNTIYRGASVKIQLLSSSNQVVKFDGIQPAVDSTGRANNLFRRVDARLKIGDDFPYPNYAADVNNSLCKDFSVDNTRAISGSCTP